MLCCAAGDGSQTLTTPPAPHRDSRPILLMRAHTHLCISQYGHGCVCPHTCLDMFCLPCFSWYTVVFFMGQLTLGCDSGPPCTLQAVPCCPGRSMCHQLVPDSRPSHAPPRVNNRQTRGLLSQPPALPTGGWPPGSARGSPGGQSSRGRPRGLQHQAAGSRGGLGVPLGVTAFQNRACLWSSPGCAAGAGVRSQEARAGF